MVEISAGISARLAKSLRRAALILGAGMPGLAAALEWNREPALASIVHDFYGLHAYVMLFVTVLLVGVFGFMFFSVYAHRKSKDCETGHFHENTTVEILWTVIPVIVLVVIAWPVAKTVVAQNNRSNPGITDKVTGDPWKRGYDYTGGESAGISVIPTATTQHGAKVYAANCALHQASGEGMPATSRQRPGAEHSMSAVLDHHDHVSVSGNPCLAKLSFHEGMNLISLSPV